MKKSRLLGLVAVLVLAAGGAATFAWAQTNDTTTIRACVDNDNGRVRIVRANQNCQRGETAESWNITGPQGPQGLQGQPGRDGRDGQPGPQGPAGSNGSGGGGGGGGMLGTIAITAQKQGSLGPFNVSGFDHEIVSPRDPASGLPTGKRQHKPFKVVMEVGAEDPLLMNALVTNENLTNVTISFFKPGTSTVGTTVKLTNANVASFTHECTTSTTGCETIAFTYQKIEWTWVDGGISAVDDWEAPVA